jgi:hypothetical protein
MFGMPTRVRNLYIAPLHSKDHAGEWEATEWTLADRDTELAIFEFAPGAVLTKDKQEHQCVGFTPPLKQDYSPDGEWWNTRRISDGNRDNADAFGPPFWIGQCPNCGAWKREDDEPRNEHGVSCTVCGAEFDISTFHVSREPLAYRTDFRPSPAKEDPQTGSRYRATHAVSGDVHLFPMPDINLSVSFGDAVRTFRLNRGKAVPQDGGGIVHRGFTTQAGSQSLRVPGGRYGAIELFGQHIENDFVSVNGRPGTALHDVLPGHSELWLGAPKTTDGLYLAHTSPLLGLWLDQVSGPSLNIGIRAAALSATFLIVDKASMFLDIDPDDFEVLEPVQLRPGGGDPVTLLQITDHLVNGAGFCRRLTEPDGNTTRIAVLLREMLEDVAAHPLDDFLQHAHTAECDQACYKCMLRYRNQPYHGLLDWQLGLSYVESLLDPRYDAGLSGNFDRSPFLSLWPRWSTRYAEQMAASFEGEAGQIGNLAYFRLPDRLSEPILVVHPFWNTTSPAGILRTAMEELADRFGFAPKFADTFNLARRPGWVVERLK